MLTNACSSRSYLHFAVSTMHTTMQSKNYRQSIQSVPNVPSPYSSRISLIKKGMIKIGLFCIWTAKKTICSIAKLSAGILIQCAIHDPLQKSGKLLATIGCTYPPNFELPGHFCDKNIYELVVLSGLFQSIGEEILFRGIIQGFCLSFIPRLIENADFPKKELFMDQRVIKVSRVILLTTIFASCHVLNVSNESKYQNNISACGSYTREQIAGTCLAYLFYSTLQESRLGLLGTMGAHVTNNLIVISRNRMWCYGHPNPWLSARGFE